MGLTQPFLEAHIRAWEHKLTGVTYPHRARWPSHLFHHAPLENVIGILTSGQLLSRNDSALLRARDIAAPSVIDHSQRAHRFARLYFRPRTPTQFNIEGIRRPGECPWGDNTHAPVLIMLVFDARKVLLSKGVLFSDRNMQSGAIENCTEDFFARIPFDKVYHEGGFAGDQSIKAHRCAEVLVPSPMEIQDSLARIYCRSEAELTTLMQKLSDANRLKWRSIIRVSDDLKVFERNFAFVESVSLSNEGVVFHLNPRKDSQPIKTRVDAWEDNGKLLFSYQNTVAARPSATGSWKIRAELKGGVYRVRIEIENHLAFDAKLKLDDNPF